MTSSSSSPATESAATPSESIAASATQQVDLSPGLDVHPRSGSLGKATPVSEDSDIAGEASTHHESSSAAQVAESGEDSTHLGSDSTTLLAESGKDSTHHESSSAAQVAESGEDSTDRESESATLLAEAVAAEQKVVDGFFSYVDADRARTEAQIKRVLAERTHDPRGLVERETAYGTLGDHLIHLSAAEIGLAFGRIDIEDPEAENPSPFRAVSSDSQDGTNRISPPEESEQPAPGNASAHPSAGSPSTALSVDRRYSSVDRRYIGRIGLSDRKDGYRTLLIDWRAPAARPFYTATTAHPDGVLVRRHLRTTGRKVSSVHDEVLQDSIYVGDTQAPGTVHTQDNTDPQQPNGSEQSKGVESQSHQLRQSASQLQDASSSTANPEEQGNSPSTANPEEQGNSPSKASPTQQGNLQSHTNRAPHPPFRGEPGNPLVTSHTAHAGDESPLLEALNAARTGHMTDIVETIQHEQDDIIRDHTRGVTVVEGGPGTGKTAVALHRAAYLLYTYRELLAPRGVLVIGPNDTFMDYISRVLPTLGEGGVVLRTIGTLYPGVTATLPASLLEREVKGSEEMLAILAEHVRSYQRVPRDLTVVVDGFPIAIPPKDIRAARTRARRSKLPHNAAQAVFRRVLLDRVAQLAAEEIGKDPLGEMKLDIGPEPLEPISLLDAADIADIRADLDHDEDILAAINEMWPILEPQQVLHDLVSSDEAIAQAAAEYDELTWAGLRRTCGAADNDKLSGASLRYASGTEDTNSDHSQHAARETRSDSTDGGEVPSNDSKALATTGEAPRSESGVPSSECGGVPSLEFSVADIALLDELAEILGPMPEEADESAREWALQLQEAQEALDILQGSVNQDSDREDGFDPEILQAFDVIDAEALAERHRVRDHRTTAQRAAEDRTWAYGHVIIDEAQELSPMEWRMVLRRSPNRWMTLVGDTAQTGNPAGVESWKETLAPLVDQRWHIHHLTVNYRTPADIAELADQLLPHIAPGRVPARAIRTTGWGVRMVQINGTSWASSLREVLAELETELARTDAEMLRSVAVIVPDTWTQENYGQSIPDTVAPPQPVSFSELTAVARCGERLLRVLPSRDVKGLEFDYVVVLAPDQIAAASPQGYQDLYVSLTRATQGLVVIHDGDPVVEV